MPVGPWSVGYSIQYHMLTALKQAVKGTKYERAWYGRIGGMIRKPPGRCPFCNSTRLFLRRIWSRQAGSIYDCFRDDQKPTPYRRFGTPPLSFREVGRSEQLELPLQF